MQELPRTLFITNCCFSLSSNAGRTLKEMFSFMPKEKIAQFFLRKDDIDFNICDNYFQMSDVQMMRNFYSRAGGVINKYDSENKLQTTRYITTKKKSPINVMLRDFLWNLNLWKKQGFDKWVEEFTPQMVVTIVGTTSFIFNIACEVARKYDIPLLVINTESYYLKDYNYFSGSSWYSTLFYPLYHSLYKKGYEKLMERTSYVIYCCEKLKTDYEKIFNVRGMTIYTPSSISVKEYKPLVGKMRICYLGNLGLNRHKSLIEIGKVLVEHKLQIQVFGSATEAVANELNNAVGITFHGKIPYSQVVKEIEDADILLHVESFTPFYVEDIKYGFSTKIADCLMSGRCLFIYAASTIACAEYIASFNPDCVASSKEELKIKLDRLIQDADLRAKSIKNNLYFAKKNHSKELITEKILSIINSIMITRV